MPLSIASKKRGEMRLLPRRRGSGVVEASADNVRNEGEVLEVIDLLEDHDDLSPSVTTPRSRNQ